MRYGIYAPTSGVYDIGALVTLARETEAAGWDGFFIWDNIMATYDGSGELTDTTVALTAIAMVTKRIQFGVLVIPMARRRPWKVAKETATLDRMSGGRLIVGAGLGGQWDFDPVGELSLGRQRTQVLDESLEVLVSLWSGNLVSHSWNHFTLESARIVPSPIQRPRIPIWIAGHWPLRAPFQRAAKWDGVVPIRAGHTFEGLTPTEIRECVTYIMTLRSQVSAFDVIYFHRSAERSPDLVLEYQAAGATWWMESTFPVTETLDEFRRRITAGPPILRGTRGELFQVIHH